MELGRLIHHFGIPYNFFNAGMGSSHVGPFLCCDFYSKYELTMVPVF
jgi:hypothetical protein